MVYFVNYLIYAIKNKKSYYHCLGDENKPKSWSKYASDSTAYKKEHSTSKPEEFVSNDKSKIKKKSKLKSEVEEKIKQVIFLK